MLALRRAFTEKNGRYFSSSWSAKGNRQGAAAGIHMEFCLFREGKEFCIREGKEFVLGKGVWRRGGKALLILCGMIIREGKGRRL